MGTSGDGVISSFLTAGMDISLWNANNPGGGIKDAAEK